VKNQVLTGTPTSRRFALCPSTVKAGDPVFLGTIPAVALDDYQTLTLGTTSLTNGSFALSVTAKSALSPSTGHAINPGDTVYADGGTLDSTTNVKTGFTLDANSSTGTAFGTLDPEQALIASTVTNASAWVRI
jgi:predicted RecA/RadA family phage recombinase